MIFWGQNWGWGHPLVKKQKQAKFLPPGGSFSPPSKIKPIVDAYTAQDKVNIFMRLLFFANFEWNEIVKITLNESEFHIDTAKYNSLTLSKN